MKTVSADSRYDSNHLGEGIEWTEAGKRTCRRFLYPENPRNSKPAKSNQPSEPRDESHRGRLLRKPHLRSRRGKAT